MLMQRPGHGVTNRHGDESQQVVVAAKARQDLVRHKLLDGGVPVVVQDHPAADAHDGSRRYDRHWLTGRQREERGSQEH
jgi:hypothetical protein